MSTTQSGDAADRTPSERVDVCVIGAGPAGALLAHSLAERGHEVVLLEAGERFDASERVERMKRQIRPGHGVGDIWEMGGERDAYTTSGEMDWPLNERRVKGSGGTTLHWGGVATRLREEDFEMASRHGIAADWPISYRDLMPYYARAERELGVAGDPDAPFQPPREEPFPMEAFPPSHSDRLVAEAGAELGVEIHSLPQARNVTEYDGRSGCAGYGTCQFVCPSGAKYSADVHVEKAEAEGARILDRVPVQRLEHGPDGDRVEAAVYATPDGETHRQEARRFVAACGVYETPRLLLLSASERHPDGLANSSGTVGRYLMGHPPAAVYGLVAGNTRRGEVGFCTSGTHQFYEGAPDRGSINVMLLSNAGGSAAALALGSEAWGDDLLAEIRQRYGHVVGALIAVESLPRAENRIALDTSKTDDRGNPVPDVRFSPGEYAAAAQRKAIEVCSGLVEGLDGEVALADGTTTTDELPGELHGGYHPLGGTRMGTDPSESVVDPHLRTHDLENLYLVGGGPFVTSGAANPTLTIAALSLRAADHVHETL